MFDRINTDLTSTQQTVQPTPITIDSSDESSLNLAIAIAQGADERKADNIVLLNVEEVSYLADYFVVMTGFSKVQVRAIAGAIEQNVEDKFGRSPLHIEGLSEGTWVLIDYGNVIAHIFTPTERDFYGLEAFWGHAEKKSFTELTASTELASQN
ncbi:MAG: ribosome silencing factor [Cyanobacteria bacterium P01_E01_bin.6]